METCSGRGAAYWGLRSLFVVYVPFVLLVFLVPLKCPMDTKDKRDVRGFGCRAGRTPTHIGVGIGEKPLPKNPGGTPIPRFAPMCFFMRRELEPSIRTLARPAP